MKLSSAGMKLSFAGIKLSSAGIKYRHCNGNEEHCTVMRMKNISGRMKVSAKAAIKHIP